MPQIAFLFLMISCAGNDTVTITNETGDATTTSLWTSVVEGADGAFLSIWHDRLEDELWFVGSDSGNGPQVLTYDGTEWSTIPTGITGDLWWVWGTDTTVYAVGENGHILSISKSDHTVTDTVIDSGTQLFGIWGSSDTDIWAVGGEPYSTDGASLWHFDGTLWEQYLGTPDGFEELSYAFKVWGTAADDVWAVGTSGYSMHFNGADWSPVATPIEGSFATLFTVAGDGKGAVYAVGGAGDGEVLSFDGAEWQNETPDFALQLNGVYATSGFAPIACGKKGACYERVDGRWVADGRGAASQYDIHATLVDNEGGVWVVGGYMGAYPLSNGFIAYDGPAKPAEF